MIRVNVKNSCLSISMATSGTERSVRLYGVYLSLLNFGLLAELENFKIVLLNA